MTMRTIVSLGLVASLFIMGCSDSGPEGGIFDGNPATRPTPGFTEVGWGAATSISLPPSEVALSEGILIEGDSVRLDEIRFFIRDLQLINAEDNPQFTVPGPYVERLIQQGVIVDETLPEVGGVVVKNGTYRKFDQTFAILDEENLPEEAQDDPIVTGPLLGRSMVVEGVFAGPEEAPFFGEPIPFRFLSRQTSEIRVETEQAFTLTGDFVVLFIAFKTQVWFDELIDDLQNLDPEILSSELVVLDTESSNSDLRDIALELEDNINHSFRFGISLDTQFEESELDETSFSNVF